jgi:hypothetical protein
MSDASPKPVPVPGPRSDGAPGRVTLGSREYGLGNEL